MDLRDKVVIVTGASSGLGKQLARQLLHLGASVAATGRREDRLAELVADAPDPDRALAISADITRTDELERIVKSTVERFHHLDVLVSCAGTGFAGSLDDLEIDEIDYTIKVNLLAPMLLTKLALPHLMERPKSMLVFVTSIGAEVATPSHSVYTASKFGCNGFSLAMYRELLSSQVHVLTVLPGTMDTEMASPEFKKKAEEVGLRIAYTDPEKAAASVIKAMKKEKKKTYVLSPQEKMLRYLDRFAPSLTDKALGKLAEKGREALIAGNQFFRARR